VDISLFKITLPGYGGYLKTDGYFRSGTSLRTDSSSLADTLRITAVSRKINLVLISSTVLCATVY
jgi:hypothetical protein